MNREEFIERYKKARRAAIEQSFSHLNDMQREAVLSTEGPLLLLAGAGSGKTTVLINRIANLLKYGKGAESPEVPDYAGQAELDLLENYIKSPADDKAERVRELCAADPVEPWRMIAITFTNKAAGEMKSRLINLLGSGAGDIWAMTFHAACVRILRRDIEKLGYKKSFTIYDSADSASLIKRILKEQNIDEKSFPHKSVLSQISRAKDKMLLADAFYEQGEQSGDVRKRIVGRAYIEYETRMRAANALDFDDIILNTVRLFKEHTDVLEYYQRRFKYVMIDEYQDTNNLQYMLASALAGGHGNICVVGDDDQSIYKFRGATIENILSFEKQYKNARVIRLEQNYRSNGYILDAAHDVISRNVGRKGKKLWTENVKGDKPVLKILRDERDEAQFVADTIMSHAAGGGKWQDSAVLYRMNAQSNQFETVFKRNSIPYRIIGGTGFYDRMEIKDVLAYLCVINNPDDDLRLLRIINTPARGIGMTTIGHLTRLAAEEEKPVFEILLESERYADTMKSAGRLHQFVDMINDIRKISETVPLDVLYDELISRTGYMRMLREKDSDENISRIENVNELKTNIIAFMNDNGGSLFDFLNEISLYTVLDKYDADSDAVVLMTMHSAKGLEFDTVFIAGAEEGIFPSSRAIGEPEDMEEERRLCYVAMTRAKRRLYFASAQMRMLFGKTAACIPSRFTREISAEHMDRAVANDNSPKSFTGQGVTFGNASLRGGENISDKNSTVCGVERRRHAAKKPLTPEIETNPCIELKKDDIINHKAFGTGTVQSVTQAGSDALVEVKFDDEKSGTKRLMLKSASKYITKNN